MSHAAALYTEICTSSTDYLYCLHMICSLNVSPSYTISLILQDHHARPCYTVTSIINAQISLVPSGKLLNFSKPQPPSSSIRIPQRRRMTSTFETRTRSLRYQLRSRGIYTEEHTAISSPEILSEPPPPPPPRRRMTA